MKERVLIDRQLVSILSTLPSIAWRLFGIIIRPVASTDKVKMDEASNRGRWSKEEHMQFLLGLSKYGKDWKHVQEFIQTRTRNQVRSHAQKYFLNEQRNPTADSLFYSESGRQQFKDYLEFLESLKDRKNPMLFYFAQQHYLFSRTHGILKQTPGRAWVD